MYINRNNNFVGLFGLFFTDISNLYIKSANVTSNSYSGILCGYAIKNTQRIITIDNVHVDGQLTGNGAFVGGVMGYTNASGSNVIIQNSSFIGDITSKGGGYSPAGGIFGGASNSGSTLQNCFFQGNVKQVNNGYDSGGIVGRIDTNDSNHPAYIKNCYTVGSIINGGYDVGGIIGNSRGYGAQYVQNCVALHTNVNGGNVGRVSGFYFNQTLTNNYAASLMLVNGSAVVNGTTTDRSGQNVSALTSKTQAFYQNNLGWDFTNVWKMSDPSGIYKGYPIHKSL